MISREGGFYATVRMDILRDSVPKVMSIIMHTVRYVKW